MAKIIGAAALMVCAATAQAETVNFDRRPAGHAAGRLDLRQHGRRHAALDGRGRSGRPSRRAGAEAVRQGAVSLVREAGHGASPTASSR